MTITESAVIVALPEAAGAVAATRQRLDPAAARGVPAHITVLYPFLPPERIDQAVLAAVGAAVATVPRFAVTLSEVRWFGDSVVWLAPEPAGPFQSLTAAVSERFPETPPYGGLYEEVVPHLTVGDGAPVGQLRQAADTVGRHLPIRAAVTAVQVIVSGSGEPGFWRPIAELPLGG